MGVVDSPSTVSRAIASTPFSAGQAYRRLAQVHRTIHTREGLDVMLLFLGDAARLISVILNFWRRYLPVALRKLGLEPLVSSKIAAGRHIAEAQVRVALLLPILEEWAIMHRLWGTLDTVVAAREFLTTLVNRRRNDEPIDTTDEALTAIHLAAQMSFNVCEGSSWMASKGLLSWSPKRQETLVYAAARSWAVTSCVDLTRTIMALHKNKRTYSTMEKDAEESNLLRGKLCLDIAWVAIMIHYSVRGGLYPEAVASTLGVFTSLGLLKGFWEEAA